MANGLTPKQKRFVEEYLMDFNATGAYVRAGYSPSGANRSAHKLLTNTDIETALKERVQELLHKLGIDQERVLQEFKRIGFSNIGDFLGFGPDGVRFKDSDDLSPEMLACVESVAHEETKYGNRLRLKMYDKLSALTGLARYLKLSDEAPQDEVIAILRDEAREIEIRVRSKQIPDRLRTG